jgi:hypothetical protein
MKQNQTYETLGECVSAVEEHFGLKLRQWRPDVGSLRYFQLVSPTDRVLFEVTLGCHAGEWSLGGFGWVPEFEHEHEQCVVRNSERAYLSNSLGWTEFPDKATIFFERDKATMKLPLGGFWEARS